MSISNIHFATLHPTSVEGAKAVQHLRFNVTVRRMNMSTASFMSKEGQRTMLNRNPQKRTSQLPTCKSADKNEALTHPSLPFDGRPRLHHHPPSPRLRHFQLATNFQLHRRLRFRRPLLHHQGMPPSPIPQPTPSNPPPPLKGHRRQRLPRQVLPHPLLQSHSRQSHPRRLPFRLARLQRHGASRLFHRARRRVDGGWHHAPWDAGHGEHCE